MFRISMARIWKFFSNFIGNASGGNSEDGSDLLREDPKPVIMCYATPPPLMSPRPKTPSTYSSRMGRIGLNPGALADARAIWMSLDAARGEELRKALESARNADAAKLLEVAFRQTSRHFHRTRGKGASASCYKITMQDAVLRDAREHLLTRLEYLAAFGQTGGIERSAFHDIADQIARALAVFEADHNRQLHEGGNRDAESGKIDWRAKTRMDEHQYVKSLWHPTGHAWWITDPGEAAMVAAASLGGMALKAPKGWPMLPPEKNQIHPDAAGENPGADHLKESPSPVTGRDDLGNRIRLAERIGQFLERVEAEWGIAFTDSQKIHYRNDAFKGLIHERYFDSDIFQMVERIGKLPPLHKEIEKELYSDYLKKARMVLNQGLKPPAAPDAIGPDTDLNGLAPCYKRYKLFKRLENTLGSSTLRDSDWGCFAWMCLPVVAAVAAEWTLRPLYGLWLSLPSAALAAAMALGLTRVFLWLADRYLLAKSRFKTLGDYILQAANDRIRDCRERLENTKKNRFKERIRELFLACMDESGESAAIGSGVGSVVIGTSTDAKADFSGLHGSNVVPGGYCPVCGETVGEGATRCHACGYCPFP